MLKHIKYQAVKAVHDFVPIAVETLGTINNEGMSFLRELGGQLSTASRDPRETSFLFQRVYVCMQRANAVAFRGSFLNFYEVLRHRSRRLGGCLSVRYLRLIF